MPPVSSNSVEYATGKLARKIFLIFFTIAIIPIGIILVVVYQNVNWLLPRLSMLDQQRGVVLILCLILLVASLVALAAHRITRPVNQLVRIAGEFAGGDLDQRANLKSDDEFGLLALQFNALADEICLAERQASIQGSHADVTSPKWVIEMARIVASSKNLDELLHNGLDLVIRQFPCSYAAIYLLEGKVLARAAYLNLAQSAGVLTSGDHPLTSPELMGNRINLDTTPTMDWLVGKAIAFRQPQVGLTKGESNLHEAALPITKINQGVEEQVIGVLYLVKDNRAENNQVFPFTEPMIAELQILATILASGLANFLKDPEGLSADAPEKQLTNLPDLQTVFSTSREIAEAENSGQVYQALGHLLATSPFAYFVFKRPDDSMVDTHGDDVFMEIIEECNSNHKQSFFSSTPAEALPRPPLAPLERFFIGRQHEAYIISDFSMAEIEPTLPSRLHPLAVLPFGRDEHLPPHELAVLANALGCRTVAVIAAMRNDKLLAILIIGTTTHQPPLTNKSEFIKSYQDLLDLVVSRLERIQSRQNTQRQLVEMETFWQVSQAISSETDLDALYALINRQVEKAMGHISSFGIVLYDAKSNQISIPYMLEEGQWLTIPPFPLGNGFSSEIIRTRRPLLMFTQNEIDEKTLELNALQVGDPPKSWLGVPMLFGGQVIGLIIVQDVKLEYRFSIQDERLLSMLATQVAVVVRNARLLEATRRQAQQERLTNEISDRIRRQVDVESILKTTTDEISRALGVRRARLRIDTRVVGNDKFANGPDIIASEEPGKEVIG